MASVSDMAHVCILAESPSHPLVVTSAERGRQMFRESVYGPMVEFKKEIGLGYWSVWKDDRIVGWINLVPVL
jgi:hypothetical protein